MFLFSLTGAYSSDVPAGYAFTFRVAAGALIVTALLQLTVDGGATA
jgi:hypothetical protein